VELIINTERLPLHFEMNKTLSSEIFINSEEHILSLSEMEKQHISEVLLKNNFNIQKSASILGITRGTLYRKIEEYQIKVIH
jgi:transcriptional regulator with PAS, ATPase and Fis domain